MRMMEQFLEEESNCRLIEPLIKENKIEPTKEDMQVADAHESATVQAIQETTVADRQEQAIEKAIVAYPDVYALAENKDNQY